MTNTLSYPLRVYYGRGGKVNLYIYHPIGFCWGNYKEKANQNRHLVNWVRKMWPHILNEVREIPSGYDQYGGCYGRDPVFCFYGLTKKEYMMLKLGWNFKEFRMNGSKPRGGKRRIDYVAPYYQKPTGECKARFAKAGYKPKPLRIND